MARGRKFPTFWVIILVLSVIWLFGELGYINFDVPWLPIIIIIFAVGAIFNNYR